MAVERVREGESASEVIAAYGFNRTTIYKWLNAALRPGLGIKALRSTKASGRPRSLTPKQEAQVFRWINGRDPRQYGLDFGLWTRSVVAELIEKKLGIALGLTAVGELLAKLGLTPQKPLQRAYQRDPQAIEKWQRETFPAIVRQAKAEGAEIFFWDEYGFRAETVHGKTWGVRGKTPVVQRPGQRQAISAASAVNAKGAFWFCIYEGGLNAGLFVELLRKMMKYRKKPIHLVLDSLPAHKTAQVKQVCRIDRRSPDAALPAWLCTRSEPRRTGMESCQAHRHGKATFAERRKTARQNRGAACKTPANAKTRSLILQSPVCRLYWRLLSNVNMSNTSSLNQSGCDLSPVFHYFMRCLSQVRRSGNWRVVTRQAD